MAMLLKSVAFFLLLFPALVFAGLEQLSEDEFRELAAVLAPKVNLFQKVWEQDKEAVFYGGTTRDYLYWLKGKFRDANSHADAEKIIHELKSLPLIDVRSFIIGDSDVDIIAKKRPAVNVAEFGVHKLDAISADIFDPQTVMGKNEIWQGHIPAEKIRLMRKGLFQDPELGDGVHEIYKGKLTVHFSDPERFSQTKYAQAGENHPILLALRFLRLQAINYYQTHGAGVPHKQLLQAAMDPVSSARVKEIIQQSLQSHDLDAYLEKNRFRSWINGTIQKSFRSYTNPTAALELMKEFGVDQLSGVYGEKLIESVYQYVFSEYRDLEKIKDRLKEFQVDEARFFENINDHFPDGRIYHGTKTEAAFRSILFQGVLPSSAGSAGRGLYGVNSENKKHAEEWGESPERLLSLPIRTHARIVDISKEGEGKRVWDKYSQKFGTGKVEEFARAFGIDILKYPYHFEAYVVENSDVLGRAQGVNRQLLPLQELLAKAALLQNADELLKLLDVNQLTSKEISIVLHQSPIPAEKLLAAMDEFAGRDLIHALDRYREFDLWKRNVQRYEPLILKKGDGSHILEVLENIAERTQHNPQAILQAIQQIDSSPGHSAILEFLETNLKRPYGFAAILSLIRKGDTGFFSNYWNLAQWNFSKAEQEKIFAEIIIRLNKNSNGTTVNAFKAEFNRNLTRERLPIFRQFVQNMRLPLVNKVGRPDLNLSDELFAIAVEKAEKFPEILEWYLASTENEAILDKIIKDVFVLGHGELAKNKKLQSEFVQKFFPKADSAALGLNHKGWEKDLGALRRFSQYLEKFEKAGGAEKEVVIFNSLIAKELLENKLLLKDENLAIRILNNKKLNPDYLSEVLKLDLRKSPKILSVLLSVLPDHNDTQRFGPFVEAFEKALQQNEAAINADLIRQMLKMKYHDVAFIALAADLLMAPRWQQYPDLVVDLAFFVQRAVMPPSLVEKMHLLLEQPHWRDHPAFQSLKNENSVSMLEVIVAQLKKRGHLPSGCDSFFEKLN